jgi:5'-methylthioadenosine phosphorylase
MEQAEIGIFGGTGIYDSGLLSETKEIILDTPFGKTSDSITVGIFKGKKVAFMPRHGRKHTIPPHLGLQRDGHKKNNCTICCRKSARKT